MDIYLAGISPWRETGLYDDIVRNNKPNFLESYYYVDKYTEKLLPIYKNFMLDSGAFTFMQVSNNHPNWEEYIEGYANFINKHNVKNFFELDIDYIVGYEKVKEYRRKLIKLTNKQPIPVFHKTRGIKEFTKMCEEFPYVAIGASGRNKDSLWTRRNPETLNYFIKTAHKYNAKIHGLGFTKLSLLPKIHFDSVDSTAWTTGNRFGFVWRFNGTTMEKIQMPNKRLRDPRKVALINFIEWNKFQKYAEVKL